MMVRLIYPKPRDPEVRDMDALPELEDQIVAGRDIYRVLARRNHPDGWTVLCGWYTRDRS